MKPHRTNSGARPRGRPQALAALSALLLVLLVSCSSLSDRPGSLASADEPAYLLTVQLQDGDDQAEILSLYGGEIEVWVDGRFAVLGYSSAEAQTGPGEFALLGTSGLEPNHEFRAEPNAIGMQGTSTLWAGGTSTLWAGGTSRIWAGGTSYLWAGGTSYLWAGGHFAWMPENTEVWKQIRLDEAHRMVASTLGAGVRVAVIDTGVDVDHPALKEAVGQGYDFVDDDFDPDEEGNAGDAGYGHGTNVAGIVRQIAPRATILPYRVLSPEGSGTANLLAAAISRAVEHGADIINLSLGGAEPDRAVVESLLLAAQEGVFVFASSGDSGNREVTFPASAAPLSDHLVSLTSVDKQDHKSEFAPFHEFLIELSSPGESIFGPAPDMKAAAWSGTSMSAPMAAGALALALSAAGGPAELKMRGSDLTDVLLASSHDIDGLNPEYAGMLGDGRLDVASFLSRVLSPGKAPDRSNDREVPGNGHGQGQSSDGGDADGAAGHGRGAKPERAADGSDHPGRGRGKVR
ncbi:MAG TPA: S8 family serine peptidase [Trueperaceae bacterium]